MMVIVCVYTVYSTVTNNCSNPEDPCGSHTYSIVFPSVLASVIVVACFPLMYFEYRYAADLRLPEVYKCYFTVCTFGTDACQLQLG
jgi:hypothetical protein